MSGKLVGKVGGWVCGWAGGLEGEMEGGDEGGRVGDGRVDEWVAGWLGALLWPGPVQTLSAELRKSTLGFMGAAFNGLSLRAGAGSTKIVQEPLDTQK